MSSAHPEKNVVGNQQKRCGGRAGGAPPRSRPRNIFPTAPGGRITYSAYPVGPGGGDPELFRIRHYLTFLGDASENGSLDGLRTNRDNFWDRLGLEESNRDDEKFQELP